MPWKVPLVISKRRAASRCNSAISSTLIRHRSYRNFGADCQHLLWPGRWKLSSVRGTLSLTDRERDIVRLLFEGYTNREMGEKLGVSWLTVRNHISRLLVKGEAKTRTDLLARLVALRRLRHRQLIP